MRWKFIIVILVSFQIFLVAVTDAAEKHPEDQDDDDVEEDEEDYDDITGIKYSDHKADEYSYNVKHDSNTPVSLDSESQHIKSSHSDKLTDNSDAGNNFRGHDQNSVSAEKQKQTREEPGDSYKVSKGNEVEKEIVTKKPSKAADKDEILYEEAELDEGTLTDQVLSLTNKIKAKMGKAENPVSVEMVQLQDDTAKDVVNPMNKKVSSVKYSTGKQDENQIHKNDQEMDSVVETKESVWKKESQLTENKMAEAQHDITFLSNSEGEESLKHDSVTGNIKKLGHKVLEAEGITDDLAEHDDLDFPDVPDEVYKDDNLEDEPEYLMAFPEQRNQLEEVSVSTDENPYGTHSDNLPEKEAPEHVNAPTVDKISSEESSRVHASEENLVFEEESEDGSLVDEVIKMGEKLKARLDKKVDTVTDNLKKKIENEFDLIEKEIMEMRISELSDKLNSEVSGETKSLEIKIIPESVHESVSLLTRQSEEITDGRVDSKMNSDTRHLPETANQFQQLSEKVFESDTLDYNADDSLQNFKTIDSLIDSNGKSSISEDTTSVILENTIPLQVNIEPSETQVDSSKKVDRYSALSADETVLSATPTFKIMKELSDDAISQSAKLHLTPSPAVKYQHTSSLFLETEATFDSKLKEQAASANDEYLDRANEKFENDLVNFKYDTNKIPGKFEEMSVPKTEATIQPSSSDIKIEELHKATPSDKTVSSEAIFQSEHIVTAHAEETGKDKGIFHATALDKNKIMEKRTSAQTATMQTQLREEGKRKIVGHICWGFCTVAYFHLTLY